MEPQDCKDYLETLELPTPFQIMHALLSHAVFNFNMSGAGVLTDVSQIPEFLSNADEHQVVHLTQFANCLNVVGILGDGIALSEVKTAFHNVREEIDTEYIQKKTANINFEEAFLGGDNTTKEDPS